MNVALVNPRWSFAGSVYFGCREVHLPLELGYARALLNAGGARAEIVDAHAFDLDDTEIVRHVRALAPDMIVVTTAPTYLFWRCAQPELTVPMRTMRALEALPALKIAVGPHGSTTPRAALRKLGVDAVIMGECEEVIVALARTPRERWREIASIAHRTGGIEHVQGGPAAADVGSLPALEWGPAAIERHGHHHHRFDRAFEGPGAEVEATRGCPYHCTFCAKDYFRDRYRRRPLDIILRELDGLTARGVRYVYFIDEIFMPDRALLAALRDRPVEFGVQLRIDNWSPDDLALLGQAGCVSIEAGVESVTRAGRQHLQKRCKASTEELVELLVHAKKYVPFVQANLLESSFDDREAVQLFRQAVIGQGVWCNDPVPLFQYPGSPGFAARFGEMSDDAWERAHADYLNEFEKLSEIQERRPRPLSDLEGEATRG